MTRAGLKELFTLVLQIGAFFGILYVGSLLLDTLAYSTRLGVIGLILGLYTGHALTAMRYDEKIRNLERELSHYRIREELGKS
jgi:hypothetical protein